MGSRDTEADRGSDESPQHQVTVPDFFMGRYEVTQAQYEAVMGTNPANFQGANNPVERVSWEDAQEFCRRLSQLTGRTYRLPTEAEWEYAARAGTTTPFSYGESITPAVVNYDGRYPYGNAPQGEYRGNTIAVNTLYPNAWGLYHIHGNAREWVQDQYRDSYSNKPSNLVSDGSIPWITNTNVLPENDLRVLRGGSWVSYAGVTRSAGRVGFRTDLRDYDSGFRVVLVR
jgi:formylglycine-generating enzyme required for sulfatase activity